MAPLGFTVGEIVGATVALVLPVLLIALHFATRPAYFSMRDAVVVITGGSSGIGKSIAAECLKKGARVALLARKVELLQAARAELASANAGSAEGGRISVHSVDVTDDAAVHAAVAAAAAAHGGRVDALVCSAGTSSPREFRETTAADFTHLLTLNVVGCRNAVHAALPFFGRPRTTSQPQSASQSASSPSPSPARAPSAGRIVLVSSQAGQVGLFGYTAYSASKFALAGLAQSLSMELYPSNVLVSLSFPPDTDTPLLAQENTQKPAITRLLSEASATVSPEVVARGVVAGMERWVPTIGVGFDGWMLATVTAGMGPAGTVLDAAMQVLTMGLWRLVGLVYVQHFYSVVSGASAKAAAAAPPAAAPAAAAPAPASHTARSERKSQ